MIPQFKKPVIVHHFVQEDITRCTVYNKINRLETNPSINYNKKTGRLSNWGSKNNTQLKRFTNNRIGVSQRKLARKFSVSPLTINRKLSKLGIKYRKREKTPYYSEKQK